MDRPAVCERMGSIPDHAPLSVSVENQVPQDLYDAMRDFVRRHPQWDQYRLMQAALAGFLFQHGCQDRAVVRHYLDGLFQRGGHGAPLNPKPDADQGRKPAQELPSERRSDHPPLTPTPLVSLERPAKPLGSSTMHSGWRPGRAQR
ncbi:MAG: DUF2811 domain-containing protein [Synechococcaceae cyanobacterium]